MNQNKEEIAEDYNDNDTAAATSNPTYLHTGDVASFMDLQTEFIRRRDAALTNKPNSSDYSQNYVHKTKNNILAISKEEKRSKEEIKTRRTQRIKENEELMQKELQQRQRQKQILEQKAAIYDRMSRGEKLVYEDGKEAEFLVDFHSKKKQLEIQQDIQGSSRNKDDDDSTDDELKRSDDEHAKRLFLMRM